ERGDLLEELGVLVRVAELVEKERADQTRRRRHESLEIDDAEQVDAGAPDVRPARQGDKRRVPAVARTVDHHASLVSPRLLRGPARARLDVAERVEALLVVVARFERTAVAGRAAHVRFDVRVTERDPERDAGMPAHHRHIRWTAVVADDGRMRLVLL